MVKRENRAYRVRKKIMARSLHPRLSVFRSASHIYAQIIDDSKGETLVSASDFDLKKVDFGEGKTRKISMAYQVGKLIAERALKKKIKKIAFDRGGYKYHGRVESLALGAREGGLVF